MAAEVIPQCREHPNATPDQRPDAELPGDEVTRKALGVLHDNGAGSIALDLIEKSGETWSRLNRVGLSRSPGAR